MIGDDRKGNINERRMLGLIALGVMWSGALFGQNFAGTWQGKLALG